MVQFIESELVLLKKEIDEMWTLVYNQLGRAGEAVLTLDRELAQQVLVRERRVNAFELKIDSDIEDIIALYNPVAIDLRFVLAMLKINTNLERLGDFAEGIARFALNCKEPILASGLVKELRLEEMINQVSAMLELAKRALQEESQELATAVFAKDNLLDEINANATAVLADYIGKHPESALSCLNLVSVFRKLERSGDHITNIAEEIVFFIDAKVLNKLLKDNNLEFHDLFSCGTYVYLWKDHPLADQAEITMEELKEYPCLSFDQGSNNSFFLAEEVLSTYEYKRIIKANDRATMLNLMVGLNGYTLCSGIICEELNGSDYRAVPLHAEENMMIGYISRKGMSISALGQQYLEEIRKYKELVL